MAMREILFRGKSVNGIGWVEGSLRITTIQPADDAPFEHYEIEDTTYGVFPNDFMSGICETVDPNTVGQYTGLTDKNGRKIFEGDIVKNGEFTMVVVWYDFHAAFMLAFHVDGDYHEAISNSHIYLEVLGNIHDNPELLGGGEDG